MQAQLVQPHTHRIDIVLGHRTGGKQRHLAAPAFVVHFNSLAPSFALTGVNLTQVQHLALYDAAIGQPPVLHHVPVLVGLAVLESSVAAQKHPPSLEAALPLGKDQSLHYKRSGNSALYESSTCTQQRGEFAGKQR